MKRRFRLLAVPICGLTLSATAASAMSLTGPIDDPPKAIVSRSMSPVIVDGVLDEPDWEAARSIGEIRQREPHEGERATEPTEVKLLYDAQNLYVGVMCFDSDPHRVIGTQMSRDADLSADDRIEILIDSFRDRHNAFYFATNPLGALVDALIIENGELKTEWDAIWLVRTRRSDKGWTAEFAIPFKSLGFHRGRQTWGFNVSRTIKRKLEEDRWASPRLDLAFFQVSEAGEIAGLDTIEQGKGLDVRPYLSNRALGNRNRGNGARINPGADIFYNVTPSLKWTTTINTDFAETGCSRLLKLRTASRCRWATTASIAGVFSSIASKRRWKIDYESWFGAFWSGRASVFETGFAYKLAPHFQTGISLEQTFASLEEGDFVARLVVVRADYSVSPLLTFFNLVQFDNEQSNLGWQSRVRWTLRPGNDMFFVFSQGWLQDEARGLSLRPTDTKLAGKVQYTFRF